MEGIFLLYVLLTSIFLLSGALIIVTKYLLNVLKRDIKYQKDIDGIIQEAEKKADHIISSATDKAHEIIRQTEVVSKNATGSLDEVIASLRGKQQEELRKVSEVLLEEYKTALDNLYRNNIDLFRTISKSIEQKANFEINDFGEIMRQETLESQKIVGQKIEARFQEIQKELENYRADQLEKLKQNLYKITQNAVELAIGKSLNRELHEELLMEALKQAIEETSNTGENKAT